MRTVTNPVVVWVLFGGTLFALYFSPLFELSLRNPWVHQAVHLHFLAVGCLFAWVAVGIDALPRRLPHPARLLFVLLAVPFHAFLGLAVLSADEHPLGADVYGAAVRDWGSTSPPTSGSGLGCCGPSATCWAWWSAASSWCIGSRRTSADRHVKIGCWTRTRCRCV